MPFDKLRTGLSKDLFRASLRGDGRKSPASFISATAVHHDVTGRSGERGAAVEDVIVNPPWPETDRKRLPRLRQESSRSGGSLLPMRRSTGVKNCKARKLIVLIKTAISYKP
jgi:hypothetical protein